jgi:hypothetical protein
MGEAGELGQWSDRRLPECQTGLPDFSCYKIPKREKIHQITIKCTKWPQNIPNGHKIYQMATKYTKWPQNRPNGHENIPTSIIARPSKIYPNWDFWFEKKAIWQPWFQTSKFCTVFYLTLFTYIDGKHCFDFNYQKIVIAENGWRRTVRTNWSGKSDREAGGPGGVSSPTYI